MVLRKSGARLGQRGPWQRGGKRIRGGKRQRGAGVSNTDSFIQEVTEEVRRDRLFALMRRYAWIAVLAVVLIVGGAAWNEWRKAQERAAAEATGDAMMAALEGNSPEARAEALAEIPAEDAEHRIVVDFARAGELVAADETEAAVALLQEIASTGDVPQVYTRIAGFRALTLQTDLPVEERRVQFEAYLPQGGILRLLADEQLALIDIETGQPDAAIERAQGILEDSEASAGLRRRATQMIVALGGEVPQSAATGAIAPVQD